MKAIWNLGFRPFFLLGSVWGVLQIAIWVIFQAGWLPSIPYHDPVVWHVHEMIFGFATAIMAGFVLTASQNWSGKPGVQGSNLILLVVLWSSARILSIIWEAQPLLFAITDLAFFPLLAYFLKPYLWQESQKRNKIFFLLFLVLAGTNLTIHLNALGFTNLETRPALFGCVFIFIIMISLIGGRVIPFFTTNVIANAKPAQNMWIEKLHLISLAITAGLVMFWEFSIITAVAALLTGIIQSIRYFLWQPWKSIKVPILLILYLGYIWIPIGLFLRACASMEWISSSPSTHAFTSGAIGIMIYGMITRVSLGHTGRKIHATSIIILSYVFILASSLIRVFGPLALPEHNLSFIEISGWLWFGAFTIFTIVYAPILCKPREDGKPG
mgnify:CR=1 FL=1|jgi:uncharacterized protein involved in response to NO